MLTLVTNNFFIVNCFLKATPFLACSSICKDLSFSSNFIKEADREDMSLG